MWEDIKAWFKAQGGFAHVVAGVWIFAFAAYPLVPAYHQFVIDVWAKTPAGLKEAIPAVIGLVGFYTSTHKEAPSGE
jgi:hypothetical protein